MIAEAFLLCVLAPTPIAMAHSPGSIKATRLVMNAAKQLSHQDLRIRVLFIGGPPAAVMNYRRAGVAAFGALVDDYPGGTAYHAIADAGKLAFQSGAFHSVYWSASNQACDTLFHELVDALRLVEAGGLFLFDDEAMPYWPTYLKGRNWVRAPFRLGPFSVWEQRSTNDTYKKHSRIGASA